MNYYQQLKIWWRSKKVPKDLVECHEHLDKKIGKYVRDEILNKEVLPIDGHHGIGRWMRNEWGLWHGGPLREWFYDHRFHHPDDMSHVILETYFAKLRGKEWDLEALQKKYEQFYIKRGLDIDLEIKKSRSV